VTKRLPEINRIYCVDALEFLKEIPDESIDMIFADPPYFGGQKGNIIQRTDGYAGNRFYTNKAKWAFGKDLQFQLSFAYDWLKECQRILKTGTTIWVTGTYHSIGVINVVMQDLKYKILNEIILVKKNAPPNFTGSCFRAITENMLWGKKNQKGRLKFNYNFMKQFNNGRQMHNVWEYIALKNNFRHPATKQESILEKVILAGSNKGDLILDPFCGSGTTGVVAQKLGRNWIMFDIEPDYCELSKKRICGEI
jgi:site-specific DNA-methyltransferase (adenine-specific)